MSFEKKMLQSMAEISSFLPDLKGKKGERSVEDNDGDLDIKSTRVFFPARVGGFHFEGSGFQKKRHNGRWAIVVMVVVVVVAVPKKNGLRHMDDLILSTCRFSLDNIIS